MERKRIVFYLPYKASMWDSLEEFWRRDMADENTNVFVMPIPYYEKNEDGSAKEVHWEVNEYPKDVSVVDFRQVDLKAVHPDAIYIHNPYDDNNMVTSVLPQFYSSVLREYTSELVYVPYFVAYDTYSVEYMKVFSCTAGVYFAHKVIVQSRHVADLYIEAFVSEYGEEYREQISAKFTEFFSSKLEKARKTTKENVDIPEAWRKYLQKPDGSWKKVILYNNSLATVDFLHEKVLPKYRWVLKKFYQRRDEICLLWRPHPFLMETLRSMYPALYEEYSAIVNEYKAGDWGIFDDTSDLNRAIALADGYYGDHSSLVQLFHAAGKFSIVNDYNVLED